MKRLKRSSTFNNLRKHTNYGCKKNSNENKQFKSLKSRRSLDSQNIIDNNNSNSKSNSIPNGLVKNESQNEICTNNNYNKTNSTSNNIPTKTQDLISLAEKGRIGKQGSSGGSCSSEGGSADIEDESQETSNKNNKKPSSKPSRLIQLQRSDAIDEETKSNSSNNGYEKSESDGLSSNSQDYSSSQAHSHLMKKYASIDVKFAYDAPTKKLLITVEKADDIPCKEHRGGTNQIHVRLVLLPHKRQRHKTKMKQSGNCVVFNETFTFTRINPKDVINLGIRFRLYGTLFTKKEHIIGEAIIAFACIKPQQQETKLCLTMEPRSGQSVSNLIIALNDDIYHYKIFRF